MLYEFVIYGQESNIKELCEELLTEQTAWDVIEKNDFPFKSHQKLLINVYITMSSAVLSDEPGHCAVWRLTIIISSAEVCVHPGSSNFV